MGLARKYASATSDGEISTGVQTIPGAKTFSSPLAAPSAAFAGAVSASNLIPATPTTPGFAVAGALPGLPNATAIAAGNIGEMIFPTSQTFTIAIGGDGAVTNLNTLLLTPGKWRVEGFLTYGGTAISGGTYTTVALTTVAASLNNNDAREGLIQNGSTFVPGVYGGISQVFRTIEVSVNTTVWLVARMGSASRTGNWADCNGLSMRATRIA